MAGVALPGSLCKSHPCSAIWCDLTTRPGEGGGFPAAFGLVIMEAAGLLVHAKICHRDQFPVLKDNDSCHANI